MPHYNKLQYWEPKRYICKYRPSPSDYRHCLVGRVMAEVSYLFYCEFQPSLET